MEFWRQLWRVIERSDLIIQIVDSRHPLLFRSEDLDKYVKEVSSLKNNLVLINKADFLTEEQREIWAKYLTNENINFAFFSAIAEETLEEIEDCNTEDANVEHSNISSSKTDILTSSQLIDLFRSFKRYESEDITVGFIGYPNVGKSSTINSVL